VSAAAGTLRRLEVWLIAALVAADQVTKAVIVREIPLHSTVTLVPGLLGLTHVRNTGAAFGFLNSVDFPHKWIVVTVAAVVALAAIAVYAGRFAGETRLARSGLAMVLAGAVGNLIDRATLGYVIDFVDVHYAGWHFWAFNVADAAITLGAAALILDIVRTPRHVPEAV
jgi:signal peptidase II